MVQIVQALRFRLKLVQNVQALRSVQAVQIVSEILVKCDSALCIIILDSLSKLSGDL
jgi:hypothetical protein